jgi:FAD-NAD(P)-binding
MRDAAVGELAGGVVRNGLEAPCVMDVEGRCQIRVLGRRFRWNPRLRHGERPRPDVGDEGRAWMRVALKVAVVGAGPKGTMMVNRLCAHAAALAGAFDLEVHVVDPFPPGSGRVWRADQPASLLMNTPAADATVFVDCTSGFTGPEMPGPSLYEWARLVCAGRVGGLAPRWREFARSVGPDSQVPRAFYGEYLGWAFWHLVERAGAAGAVVRVHRGRAVSLTDRPGGGQRLEVEADGGVRALEIGAVVLTQGHYEVLPAAAEQERAQAARELGLTYIAPVCAAEADLSGISAGAAVILHGLGLSFYDYVTLLTIGRGGEFSRSGSRLRYAASGREPVIYAGSGRGVPYPVRADSATPGPGPFRPRFFTHEAIAQLRRGGPGVGDFAQEVWPLVAKEVGWAFYAVQYRQVHGAGGFESFTHRYAAAEWDSPQMRALLEDVFPDPALRWDWDAYARPGAEREFSGRTQFHAFVAAYERTVLEQAVAGVESSAHRAATAVLRRLREQVRLSVGHHGVTGSSYRHDVEGWFHGLTNFLVAGPPQVRVEQVLALLETGVVHLVGPGMRVGIDREAGAFTAESPAVAGTPVSAETLIEARLPSADVRRAADPLLSRLLAAGGCRAHVIADTAGPGHPVGSLDVTEDGFRLVGADGSEHPRRFAYGVPLRGIQGPFGSALAAAFEHCDVIARDAWAAARAEPLGASRAGMAVRGA